MYAYRPLARTLRPYLRFRYLVVALALAVVYVHGVRVEFRPEAENALAESTTERQPTRGAEPKLASFRHPASHSPAEVEQLRRRYLARYAPVAVREMRAYGIPASITLAQGLLESVAGTSRLATETNNHFGIKCFSRSCAPGHCRNFEDDHHKDFFRSYADPADSYRAHSRFLREGKRYAGLFRLAADDYRGWARGLSKAGYATDPRYADKLISLVERYDLATYDER